MFTNSTYDDFNLVILAAHCTVWTCCWLVD